MGQYYKPCVMDEDKKSVKVSICSWDFSNGAKLMEHSYVGNRFVKAAERLLATERNCCPFVWCGDYADGIVGDINAYDLAGGKDVKDWDSVPELEGEVRYIVNEDKKEFVRVPESDDDSWVIHPLPLLTCDGNGRDGGDYHGTDMDKVGIWAYDHIACKYDGWDSEGYKELEVKFSEEF